MREGKTPPLGEWLQSKEGNMPEDYYFGKYDEVAKYLLNNASTLIQE